MEETKNLNIMTISPEVSEKLIRAAADNFYDIGYAKGSVRGYSNGFGKGTLFGILTTALSGLGLYLIIKSIKDLLNSNKEDGLNGLKSVQRELKCVKATDDDGK